MAQGACAGEAEGRPSDDRSGLDCEILSISNKRIDVVKKKRIYHQHRVLHYWIVDPQVEIHRWHSDGYLEVLAAERGQRVRAKPFDVIEIDVGILFGDDEA